MAQPSSDDKPSAAERLMALLGKPMPPPPTDEQRAEWRRLDEAADAEAARIYGAEPRTIDCTRYDYAFRPVEGGHEGHVACWTLPPGGKPREGDYLLLRNGDRSAQYRVVAVDICLNVDPPTMWKADLVFAPRAVAASEDPFNLPRIKAAEVEG